MKTTLTFLIVFTTLLACQKPPVEYETALTNCVPDTIRIGNKDDYFLMTNRECILGAQLPEVLDTTMDDKIIDKFYFAGNVTVINFWFIGCEPCEKEMPGLNNLLEKYKNKKVRFLAISRNSPKDIREFVATQPFNFEQIAYGQVTTEYSFQMKWGYPTTMVVDKHLKIIYVSGGVHVSGKDAIESTLIPVIDNALKG